MLIAVPIILLYLHSCYASEILAVLPLAISTHHSVYKPILKELANRGHNLTVITAIPEKHVNYKQIIVRDPLGGPMREVDFFKKWKEYSFTVFFNLAQLSQIILHETLQSPEVVKLIHSTDQHFDAVLVESTFAQEANIVFGHKFGAPLIELYSMCSSFWLNEVVGNPYAFSYFVDYKTRLSNKMNFFGRLQNTMFGVLSIMMHRYFLIPKQQAMVDQYFNYTGWEMRPPLIQLLSNISLVIINTHVAVHYAQPLNPNIIHVAGIHIQPPKKLPQDLQRFLDSANQGVIYFSFGSHVRTSMMPESVFNVFISVFSKLRFKVLCKWDNETMPNQPSNVKISKWLPQADVLSHANVLGFISHGGLLSITESVYHGVPLVLIPLFADQKMNSIQAETVGYGISLAFNNITQHSLSWALHEITSNVGYKEAAERQSKILKDNPMPPLDTAIYWTEYVIRHNGAPHLQSAAVSLSWCQYFLIDVVTILIIIVVLVALTIYMILKAVFRFYGRKSYIALKKII